MATTPLEKLYGISKVPQMTDVPMAAKRVVVAHINKQAERWTSLKTVTLDQVYVVWSTKVLLNWKALVATALEDGMYYEVTHDGHRYETYIDAYQKVENFAVSDDDLDGETLTLL